MDQDIFTLIKDERDKLKIWVDLGKSKGEILCKGKADSLCKVRVSFFNAATTLLEGVFDGPDKLQNGEEYLGYFFLGGEKYYFQGRAQVVANMTVIPVAAELYHLQRRQNYRVRLPEIYPAFYNIVQINSSPQEISGRLADMSSQGCRVIYRMDTPLLKIGDNVVGELVISDRPGFEVKGIVRHIKVHEGNKVSQNFGIEFSPLPAILESKLFAITMELHKELFRRPS